MQGDRNRSDSAVLSTSSSRPLPTATDPRTDEELAHAEPCCAPTSQPSWAEAGAENNGRDEKEGEEGTLAEAGSSRSSSGTAAASQNTGDGSGVGKGEQDAANLSSSEKEKGKRKAAPGDDEERFKVDFEPDDAACPTHWCA